MVRLAGQPRPAYGLTRQFSVFVGSRSNTSPGTSSCRPSNSRSPGLVLADPPVGILDEATAEVAARGCGRLEAAAPRSPGRGRTALLVAHRLT